MASLPPAADSAIQRALSIAITPVLPNALSKITLGEVLQMVVRSNAGEGPGLLYFQGNLIRALMPQGLESGDRIVAKVMQGNDQLILKLLEVTKANGTVPNLKTITPGTPNQAIAFELSNIFKNIGLELGQPPLPAANIPWLGAPNPLPAANMPSSEAAKTLGEQIQNILSGLHSIENFADAAQVLSQLNSAADGTLPSYLRSTAKTLKGLAPQISLSFEERLAVALRDEISTLLTSRTEPLKLQAQIVRMLQVLEKELPPEKEAPKQHVREVLRQVMNDLQGALNKSETQQSSLSMALSRLEQFANSLMPPGSTIEPKTAGELRQLAHGLEQMANAMDSLARLNPLMRAIGEPAMIILPFLFQGLFTHAAVSFTPERAKQKRKDKEGEEEEEEISGGKTALLPYERVHFSVPLPMMGLIEVDVAHHGKEILTRFTVGEAKMGQFLLGEMEHLKKSLNEQGFELSSFAAVCVNSDSAAASAQEPDKPEPGVVA